MNDFGWYYAFPILIGAAMLALLLSLVFRSKEMDLPEHEEVDDGYTKESFERAEEDTGDEDAEPEPEQHLEAAINMQLYGGSFASSIGEAYQRADATNGKRLVAAFPELFDKYQAKNWP